MLISSMKAVFTAPTEIDTKGSLGRRRELDTTVSFIRSKGAVTILFDKVNPLRQVV